MSDNPGQTLALPVQLVAAPADRKVSVAAAALAAPGTKVPEPVETSAALATGDPRLALTLTGLGITLGLFAGLAALAVRAPAEGEAKVIGFADVALLPLYPGETDALAVGVVALLRPVAVAVAGLAVLGGDRVSEVPGLTALTLL